MATVGVNGLILTKQLTYSPGNDDEEIQSVPTVSEVREFTDETHGEHFDDHLNGEVGVDGVVCGLEDHTSSTVARHVGARLVEAQRHTVQQNDSHRRPLKPRVYPTQSRKYVLSEYRL